MPVAPKSSSNIVNTPEIHTTHDDYNDDFTGKYSQESSNSQSILINNHCFLMKKKHIGRNEHSISVKLKRIRMETWMNFIPMIRMKGNHSNDCIHSMNIKRHHKSHKCSMNVSFPSFNCTSNVSDLTWIALQFSPSFSKMCDVHGHPHRGFSSAAAGVTPTTFNFFLELPLSCFPWPATTDESSL